MSIHLCYEQLPVSHDFKVENATPHGALSKPAFVHMLPLRAWFTYVKSRDGTVTCASVDKILEGFSKSKERKISGRILPVLGVQRRRRCRSQGSADQARGRGRRRQSMPLADSHLLVNCKLKVMCTQEDVPMTNALPRKLLVQISCICFGSGHSTKPPLLIPCQYYAKREQ
jgi:hypothetical protein